MRVVHALVVLTLGSLALTTAAAQGFPALEWLRQFGTSESETPFGVAVDGAGNVYVAGYTYGALPGQTAIRYMDVFVRKYDHDGTEVWTRQFGTSEDDWANGVAADRAGNVYVAGWTLGPLPGQPFNGPTGYNDAFVRKYDSVGAELWTREFGTTSYDYAYDVAVDGGENVYVVGATEGALPGQAPLGGVDSFVRKYDAAGTEVWTRQFGTPAHESALGATADDAGNVYVAGWTRGTLPGQTSSGDYDAFVRKYDVNGAEVWTRQFGNIGEDGLDDVVVDDAGNVYGVGWTWSPSSITDAVVRKFDAAGDEVWNRQFGTEDRDWAISVAVDGLGAVFVAGLTGGALPGQTSAGGFDAYLRKYDAAGAEVWTVQFGTARDDGASGVAADGSGALYVTGFTEGEFPGQTRSGSRDAFVARWNEAATETAPCPSSQGFWKNHPEAWPVSSLTLGSETYDRGELLALLRTSPRGDASMILAHQLIASKLNLADGSDSAPISQALAHADAVLSALSGALPYGVRTSTPQGQRMTALAGILDRYNNRFLTPDCGRSEGDGPTPADPENADSQATDDVGPAGGNPAVLRPREAEWFGSLLAPLVVGLTSAVGATIVVRLRGNVRKDSSKAPRLARRGDGR